MDLVRVLGLADVAHGNPALADSLDRNAIQLIDLVDQAVGVNVVVVRADLDVAGRQDQVVLVDRVNHVHHAQLARKQLVRIDVNHHLAVFSAERRRNLGSFHNGDLVANRELSDIVQLRLAEALALQRDQTDRKAGGIEFEHHRRESAGRQALQVRQGEVGKLGHVGVGVGAGLKVHLDDADAGQRTRLHVIDAARQREEPLQAGS